MHNHVRLALRIILPLVVIAAGVAISGRLVAMKKKGGKKPQARQVTVVEVIAPKPVSRALVLRAQGEVVAARSLVVQPQVSGKVLEVHPNLVIGGRVAAGDTLLRIEKVDYDLMVAQARAQLETARQALELEKGRKVIAGREWNMVNKDRREKAGADARGRALREPQIRQAEAQVDAAKAAVRQARVNAGRALIKAPFNGLVLQENVEIGQVVAPGAQAARLVGTDHFWVQVSLPVGDLRWLNLPSAEGQLGSEAKVIHRTGGVDVERTGRVIRLLGDLDPVGRMARVLVQIDDPLGLTSGQPPLLLGAFVEVEITGKKTEGVLEVPRQALREGDQVWVLADGKLDVRDVRISRRLRDDVLIDRGLEVGDQVITTRLGTPVPGMALRLQGAAAEGEAPNAKTPPAVPASRAEAR